jgi:hypothetical protein
MKTKNKYPLLEKLGIKVYSPEKDSYVLWDDVNKVIKDKNIDKKMFADFYGVQTQGAYGPFPYDIEAVFQRIINNKLTGTQLFWD